MKDKISNILTGFRKGRSTQQLLLIMIEKWKRAFMDLSKFFDTLNHMFLLAKRETYDLQPTAIKQIESYLSGCH